MNNILFNDLIIKGIEIFYNPVVYWSIAATLIFAVFFLIIISESATNEGFWSCAAMFFAISVICEIWPISIVTAVVGYSVYSFNSAKKNYKKYKELK